jgi:hypothetical protein
MAAEGPSSCGQTNLPLYDNLIARISGVVTPRFFDCQDIVMEMGPRAVKRIARYGLRNLRSAL